jgi:hypothetical protein
MKLAIWTLMAVTFVATANDALALGKDKEHDQGSMICMDRSTKVDTASNNTGASADQTAKDAVIAL